MVEIFTKHLKKTRYRSLSYKKFHKRQNDREGQTLFWSNCKKFKLKSQDPKKNTFVRSCALIFNSLNLTKKIKNKKKWKNSFKLIKKASYRNLQKFLFLFSTYLQYQPALWSCRWSPGKTPLKNQLKLKPGEIRPQGCPHIFMPLRVMK